MPIHRPFGNLTTSQLETLQTTYLAAVTALATAQSYTHGGRTFTKAELGKVVEVLGKIGEELQSRSETIVDRTTAVFS